MSDDLQYNPTLLHTQAMYTKPEKRAPLLKTAYHGVWSMLFPSGICPEPRIGHCFGYDKVNNRVYIAYGKNETKYYNDLWFLDVATDKWTLLKNDLLPPRAYCTATLVGRNMFIFGGEFQMDYFADLHVINLDTLEMTVIDTTGSVPGPRDSAVLFSAGNSLLLWGGNNSGNPYTETSILNLDTLQWTEYESPHTGRATPSFCLYQDKCYIFGSCKGEGLLVFDPSNQTFESISSTGTEPNHELEHSGFCAADEYLFLIGGEAMSNTMHIFAYDIKRQWWFAFHVRPDMSSLSLDDGAVSKSGLFMLPREHSESLIYCEENRTLYSILGSRMQTPPPTFQICIGEALGVIHLRSDMFEVLHQSIR